MTTLTTLQKNTLKQLTGSSRLTKETRDTLEDVVSGGASGGFSGFTYYTDTLAFFKKNRADILTLVEEMSEFFGQDPVQFIASFNCLDDDRETRAEIARTLYGRMGKEDYLVANALAWFTLEETARALTDN